MTIAHGSCGERIEIHQTNVAPIQWTIRMLETEQAAHFLFFPRFSETEQPGESVSLGSPDVSMREKQEHFCGTMKNLKQKNRNQVKPNIINPGNSTT